MFIMSLLLLSFIVFMAVLRDEQKKRQRAAYHPTVPAPARNTAQQKKPVYTTPGGIVQNLFVNALSQPHLLIAGATGSGKSVIENGLIDTVLTRLPANVKNGAQMILIDPKGNELHRYEHLPHTLFYAYEPDAMLRALQYAMDLTSRRFLELRKTDEDYYPGSDVYVFIDEFADLMTTQAKTVKPLIQRLCQLGRAARVHVIICTQTPISKVIPTEIKCNFDARFGLRARSAQDSRNIIGQNGLETLPKCGQGYYMIPPTDDKNAEITEGYYYIPYITREEIRKNIEHWENQMRLNGINPDSRKRS